MPDWSFPDFDRNDGNVERLIERRGISPDQNEEAVFNGAHARLARRGIYCAYGQDDSGRYLVLVVTMRGSTLRVISAGDGDMDAQERAFYARHRSSKGTGLERSLTSAQAARHVGGAARARRPTPGQTGLVSLRVSPGMLAGIKAVAAKRHLPDQTLPRSWIGERLDQELAALDEATTRSG